MWIRWISLATSVIRSRFSLFLIRTHRSRLVLYAHYSEEKDAYESGLRNFQSSAFPSLQSRRFIQGFLAADTLCFKYVFVGSRIPVNSPYNAQSVRSWNSASFSHVFVFASARPSSSSKMFRQAVCRSQFECSSWSCWELRMKTELSNCVADRQ